MTVKRSLLDEDVVSQMEASSKSKEEQIIDLLGGMKAAMTALTTRVQKIEEKIEERSSSSSGR